RVLIDPSWTLVASTPTARFNHIAARLGNGKVLVAGGGNDNFTALASGAVYDAVTDTWAATPPMGFTRTEHRAAALVDGTALVTGGLDNSFFYEFSAEVYNGVTGTWVPKPDMIDSRADHSATRLADGRVLLAGGHNDYGSGGGGSGGSGGAGSISNCEIYDPNLAGGSWTPASAMFTQRERHTATLLQNGTVLVAGGESSGSLLSDAEIYDPVANTWSPVPSMNSGREDFTATLLLDGTVLVTGGFAGEGLASSAEIYDPVGQSWFFVGSMNDSRVHHTATLLPSGAVLVTGGDNDGSLSSTEVYDPSSQSFFQVSSMNDSRTRHTATALVNGDVLVVGGEAGLTLASAEIFSLSPLGDFCNAGVECLSGNCADGVCCDTPCNTLCFSCTSVLKGGGMSGVCGPTKAGTPPGNGDPPPNVAGGSGKNSANAVAGGGNVVVVGGNCFDDGAETCGTNGLCDGAGSCQFYVAGTECNPAVCSAGTLMQADLCDGTGSCVVSGPTTCDPGSCVGDACDLTCAADSDCTSNGYCKTGLCTVKKPDGTPSIAANECASGIIADGVCCDTDCSGTCEACTTFLKGGGPSGVCGPIVAGTDPSDECADQGAASCGTNGSCDGAGACALYPNGAVCVPQACAGNTLLLASKCDGSGACQAGASADCTPAMCVQNVCAAVCVIDTDCLGASYCGAGGTCAAKKIEGKPAVGGNECLSNFAADGVCCDTACNAGPCDGCSVAAGAQKEGACAIFSGPACEDGDPCTMSESCLVGVCQGGGPVLCPSMDVCHDAGSCDAESGLCLPVPKADGAPCDDNNACTADSCIGGACISTHLLDGAACPGGVCIAGGCVLDANVMTGSSSSGSTSTGSTTSTSSTTGSSTSASSGGVGGEGGGSATDSGELLGSGCNTGSGAPTQGAPATLLLALLALRKRRRAQR
ncbi:MAG: kelch repeat-containing protein, partial [Minicystis sp.]